VAGLLRFDCGGKFMTVLITGANRGIGLALAQHYVADGVQVIGTHRGAVPAASQGISWRKLDVRDRASHNAVASHLKNQPLDLLVCNAGVYLEKGGDYAPEKWAETFATNVTGVYLSIESLLPNLRASRGKIAIISSNMGSDARAPGGSYIYRASKAAVLNLGRNLAADLKRDGIAVGIYHPGWVVTDMGGSSADISVEQSARGLAQRFKALSVASTGCFEDYDGTTLPF
jgi:NAD(P)-dependent dehydrogenase (short-subunit alcohol dehydrogenase family)